MNRPPPSSKLYPVPPRSRRQFTPLAPELLEEQSTTSFSDLPAELIYNIAELSPEISYPLQSVSRQFREAARPVYLRQLRETSFRSPRIPRQRILEYLRHNMIGFITRYPEYQRGRILKITEVTQEGYVVQSIQFTLSYGFNTGYIHYRGSGEGETYRYFVQNLSELPDLNTVSFGNLDLVTRYRLLRKVEPPQFAKQRIMEELRTRYQEYQNLLQVNPLIARIIFEFNILLRLSYIILTGDEQLPSFDYNIRTLSLQSVIRQEPPPTLRRDREIVDDVKRQNEELYRVVFNGIRQLP